MSAFFFSLVFVYTYLGQKNRLQVIVVSLLLAAFFFTASLWIANLIFDTSYDGQWYHEEGLIQLMNGWNPYAKGYPPNGKGASFFIAHYPQGDFLALDSLFTLMRNSIEAVKAINFLLGISAFILSLEAIKYYIHAKTRWNDLIKWLVSFTLVLNPVCMAEGFTFYQDGRMYYEMIIIIALLIIEYHRPHPVLKFGIVLNLIFLINIKFTGIELAGIISSVFLLINFLNKREKQTFHLITLFTSAAVVAFLVVGYSSYIKNTIYEHHPLYPIMGPGNIASAIPDSIQPAGFSDMNPPEKLFYSLLSLPVWSRSPLNNQSRQPFSPYDFKYYFSYIRPDTEMNGFGVFFAEIMLLTIPALFIFFFSPVSIRIKIILLTIYLLLWLSVLINPVAFVARYVPQMWLIPIVPLIGLLCLRIKFSTIYALFIFALLTLNSLLMSDSFLHVAHYHSRSISEQLMSLQKLNQPVVISSKVLSIPERLKEYKIPFKNLPDMDSSAWIPFEYAFDLAYLKK